MLHGRFAPRGVVVSQPILRVCRRGDGTWSLQGLIADPWPGPMIKNPPPIVIHNGTIELAGDVDEDDAAADFRVPASWPARARAVNRDAEVVRAEGSSPRESTTGKSQGPEPARSALNRGVAILRDVSLKIEAAEAGRLRFEGSSSR